MKTQGIKLAALAAALAATAASAQNHYVPGVEGIKAASLPPPGVYVRDYNVLYYADRLNDTRGNEVISPMFKRVFVYANVPRVIWITDYQLFGGYIGIDGLLPVQYTESRTRGFGGTDDFGIGDFFGEVTWSKHTPAWDFSLGYGLWMPTADSSIGANGSGFWGHMFTAGATWHLDDDRRWSISALNRYEISHEYQGRTPGQYYTVEGGVSYALSKTIDFGGVGYFQQEVVPAEGVPASRRSRVAGVGPELSVLWPAIGVNTSLRYLYEFDSQNRPQGHTVALTLTKRF